MPTYPRDYYDRPARIGDAFGKGLQSGIGTGIENTMLRRRQEEEDAREDAKKLQDLRVDLQTKRYQKRKVSSIGPEGDSRIINSVEIAPDEVWDLYETPEDKASAELATEEQEADIKLKKERAGYYEKGGFRSGGKGKGKEKSSEDWAKQLDRLEKKLSDEKGVLYDREDWSENEKETYDYLTNQYNESIGLKSKRGLGGALAGTAGGQGTTDGPAERGEELSGEASAVVENVKALTEVGATPEDIEQYIIDSGFTREEIDQLIAESLGGL